MIHLVSSQPVQWPAAQAPSVAQVSPVSAVSATQRSKGEGQSSTGSERDPRLPAASPQKISEDKASASSGSAPLLPRASSSSERSAAAVRDDATLQQGVREERKAEEETSAKALNLVEILSTVWKASAAVVEDALGIGAAAAKGELKTVATQPLADAAKASKSAVAPNKETSGTSKAVESPLLGRAAGDPIAYTEQGASEWMTIETGQLVKKQV